MCCRERSRCTLTYGVAHDLATGLRAWYVDVSGLLMSESTREPYFDLQRALKAVEDACAGREAVLPGPTGDALKQLGSCLRTGTTDDVATRVGPRLTNSLSTCGSGASGQGVRHVDPRLEIRPGGHGRVTRECRQHVALAGADGYKSLARRPSRDGRYVVGSGEAAPQDALPGGGMAGLRAGRGRADCRRCGPFPRRSGEPPRLACALAVRGDPPASPIPPRQARCERVPLTEGSDVGGESSAGRGCSSGHETGFLGGLSGSGRSVVRSGTGASVGERRRVGRFARWASSPCFSFGRPCDLPGLCCERVVRHEASMIEWTERSNGGPSQRVVEAGGSLALEAQGAGGSSPDNDGTGRHRQTARVRQARREGVARANQWLNPLKRGSGSNLADVGRDVAHAGPGGLVTPWLVFRGWRGGHGEGLRRTHGEAAGEKPGAAPVDRSAMNVGTT
jgi:hypothetical protein